MSKSIKNIEISFAKIYFEKYEIENLSKFRDKLAKINYIFKQRLNKNLIMKNAHHEAHISS